MVNKPEESYRIEGVKTDVFLTLAHSNAIRDFSMDAVSNTPYSDVRCRQRMKGRTALTESVRTRRKNTLDSFRLLLVTRTASRPSRKSL